MKRLHTESSLTLQQPLRQKVLQWNFYVVIFMTCEGVRVTFTLSLKALSGSSLLTTVPQHSPAFTVAGCTLTPLFFRSHCALSLIKV